MTRPSRRTDSTHAQFRKRIPSDVAAKLAGKRVTFTFPDENGSGEPVVIHAVAGRELIKFSLRTRNPATAKARSGLALAHLEHTFAAVRRGPQPLDHKTRIRLAGLIYREYVACWENDPGTPEDWDLYIDIYADDIDAPSKVLEPRYGHAVDAVLAGEGIVTDLESRKALLRETAVVNIQAAQRLKQNAEGDYSPDKNLERFPASRAPQQQKATGSTNGQQGQTTTFEEVFQRWLNERKPAAATVTTWRTYWGQLQAHVKHNDPGSVTKADMVAWKDALLGAGRTAKAVRDGQLAAARALFNYALENALIDANPALGVTIRQRQKAGQKMQAYGNEEVASLLALANVQTLPYRRYGAVGWSR